MLNQKDNAALEQGIALMREFYPPAMWALYEGSIQNGFSEAQAIDIAKHWLMLVMMKPSDPQKEDWKG